MKCAIEAYIYETSQVVILVLEFWLKETLIPSVLSSTANRFLM
jgi:hypothetical protein